MENRTKGNWRAWLGNDRNRLMLTVIILCVVGLINVVSTASPRIVANGGSFFGFNDITKFVLAHAMGLVLYFLIRHRDYRKWQNWSFIWKICGLVLLSMVLVLAVGPEINGAKRWLSIGNKFQIQPSEFAKLASIIFTAYMVKLEPYRSKRFPRLWSQVLYNGVYLIRHLAVGIVFAGLTMLQPDLGTAVLILWFSFWPMFMEGFDGTFTMIAIAVGGALGFCLAIFSAYRLQRIVAVIDPYQYADTIGYQAVQSITAIGSGGLFGMGFMNGTASMDYLPEVHTDFAFAAFAQEWGLIGVIFVLANLLVFTMLGIKLAQRTRDVFGRTIIWGVVFLISGQAFFNMAMVSGAMPVTGVPFPFISYGGSALMMNYMALALLVAVDKRNDAYKPVGSKQPLPSLRDEANHRFRPSK